MEKERVIIFDTTLRDGEQSPGASLNSFEKLEIAKQLRKLNVDVIEAGFPISSPEQFEAVRRISDEVEISVAALARAKEKDIQVAYDAIKGSFKPRIHTFSSTSDFHVLGKFGDSKYGKNLAEKRNTVLQMSIDAVQFAKSLCDDVEFSAEDAGRTDIGYLSEIVEATIAAGATTINIPDTTGYTLPDEFGELINQLFKRVKNINDAIISVHCHNDLGLAVANSIIAVKNGARQVECTINGIGERAGNASLEEFVMALNVRKDLLKYFTKVNTKEITNSSRLVSGYTGIIVQPNKAIVGENAFAHESGIHQDGMLKDRNTYEIMTPETVGAVKTKIVLGRHSGRHGLKARLEELGYKVNNDELNKIYKEFLQLSDKKKEVFDEDLIALMGDEVSLSSDIITLKSYNYFSGADLIPTATVKLIFDGEEITESSTGDGPVDAIFNAIDRSVSSNYKVESYYVRSITSGRNALGEALIRLRYNGKSFSARGLSTDIIEASAKAYVNALNKIFQSRRKEKNKELIEVQ